MPNLRAVTLLTAASVSASDVGASVSINSDITDVRANRTAGRFTVTVHAISANAILKVWIETASEEAGPWRVVDSTAWQPFTTTGKTQREVASLDSLVRVAWTLEGTSPTAYFGVDSGGVGAGAHQVYFGPDDIVSSSLQARVLEAVPLYVRANACIVASGKIERALLTAGATSPITALDERVRQAGVALAACQVLGWKGVNPNSEADKVLLDECTAAAALLDAIAEGETDPGVPPDPGGGASPGDSVVMSCPPRQRCCC